MLEGTTGKPSVYPQTLSPAILKSGQDELIKQGHKKIIISFFFSQQEILVAIATKSKSYSDATIRLLKLILLKKGSEEIMYTTSQPQ